MKGSVRRRLPFITPAAVVLLSVVAVALATMMFAGCGGTGDDGSGSPSSSAPPPTSTPAAGKPDFTSRSASPSPTGVTPVDVEGDLLVVRRDGRTWAVWRVTPATGAEEWIGEIGFEPAAAVASPSRTRVAYHSLWRKKSVLTLAVLDVGAGELRTVTVEGSGLKSILSLTWLSDTQLLVSGMPPGRNVGPEVDQLAKVDARSGAAKPFRGLQGSDPNAVPAANALVYVTAEKAPNGGDGLDGPAVREALMATSVSPGGTPREVVDGFGPDPELTAAHRVMEAPCLSPDGAFVLTAETGSDIDVTYTLRRMDDGSTVFKLHAPGDPCSAWSGDGRLALWGLGRTATRLRVWVYDVRRDAMSRSGILGEAGWVTGLDWSPRGDLAIGVLRSAEDDVEPIVRIAPGGDLNGITELSAGTLPVWLD